MLIYLKAYLEKKLKIFEIFVANFSKSGKLVLTVEQQIKVNMSGTKLSQNPNFGRCSNKKLKRKMQGLRLWANSWAILRSIHNSIGNKIEAQVMAQDNLTNGQLRSFIPVIRS